MFGEVAIIVALFRSCLDEILFHNLLSIGLFFDGVACHKSIDKDIVFLSNPIRSIDSLSVFRGIPTRINYLMKSIFLRGGRGHHNDSLIF
jgi:hypothetical protein